MSLQSRTVKELIDFLSTMPQDAIIAINQIWLREDLEEFADEGVTLEEWDKIAYYYENNEYLGQSGAETMMDGFREVTNG